MRRWLRGATAPDHHGLPGSQCLLFMVLQDALSEVAKFFFALKLRVSVVDITAFLMVKNREVAEMGKLVMKKHKEEVEKKSFKLSV